MSPQHDGLPRCNDADLAGTGPAPAHASVVLAIHGADVAVEDWDVMYGAVTARLRAAVGAHRHAPALSNTEDTTLRLRADVIECVVALELLHATLVHEVGRRRRLELDAFDVRAALALARAELAATRPISIFPSGPRSAA